MAQGTTIKGKTAAGLNMEVRVDDNGFLLFSSSAQQSSIPVKLQAVQPSIIGALNSATAIVAATDVSGIGQATITVYGTHVGVGFVIEAFDGANWYIIPFKSASVASPNIIIASGVLATNSATAYITDALLGFTQIRVRATSWTSGSATVVIDLSAQFVPIQAQVNGSVNVANNPIVGLLPTTNTTGLTMFTNGNIALLATPTTVKAGVTRLGKVYLYNPTAATIWLQCFNLLVASVTLGTTPPSISIPIPPATLITDSDIFSMNWSVGLVVAATTTKTGLTAPATGLDIILGVV